MDLIGNLTKFYLMESYCQDNKTISLNRMEKYFKGKKSESVLFKIQITYVRG